MSTATKNYTLADFRQSAPTPLNSNTAWGSQYAMQLRNVVVRHASQAPRSLQLHLGPSELGSRCDRQVAGKMARTPGTNHVSDPWPSIMGTAGHKWMELAFAAENQRSGLYRWLTEHRVTPHPDHPGTADLYDGNELAVVDHKFLGATTLAKLRNNGPSDTYYVQIKLYAHGYRLMGLPVNRVVTAAWPRTGSSVSGLYIWEEPYDPVRDLDIVKRALDITAMRKVFAQGIIDGVIGLMDVPASPDDATCYFCPFYRPEAAHKEGVIGCPGHAPITT